MDPNIFEKFSPTLKNVLVMAERIAREQNSRLDTEHQLLALILTKGTLANDILTMFEISPDRAQLVADLIGRKMRTVNGVTDTAKEAIQLAVRFASKNSHSMIDCEHLLLSLVSNKSFNSYLIIERMGVKPEEIKAQIESIFNEVKGSKQDKTPIDIEMPDQDLEMPDQMGPFGQMPGQMGMGAKTKQKSTLKQFTTNLTDMARNGKLDPVIGRDSEIDRAIQILSRRKKNNPVLIGEPGVGKTAIVEGLAQRIVEGEVPATITNKEVLSLDLGALLAGTMYRGQFESRIKNLMDEIIKNQNIILFIDEIHTVVGTGSAEGSMDAANILKPKLARGEIRVIGATTFDEYKKHIEKDAAFERRLQPVTVVEPTEEETLAILHGISDKYQQHHHVTYTDEALKQAVKLSKRYIQDRFLPDKAIDLIDEAAAATNVVSKKSRELSKLNNELRKVLEEKDEAVSNENYEKATNLRQNELELNQKITKIGKQDSRNKKNIINDNDIAKVVSRWSGIPVTNLSISEKKSFINLEERLKKYIVGQDEAIKSVSEAIRRSRVGISDPRRPIGSFIFLGPTGVGKTELVKVLTKEIFGSDDALIKIDMSEFMEKHNVSRLVGAPAGYVGYEEGGQLTEKVRRQPYSVILLDEIEKAHTEVFNILLQIMEDGELTDAKGRRVDFRNTLIIMTSNLGTDLLNKATKIGFSGSEKDDKNSEEVYDRMKEQVMQSIEKHFRPEFLNRVDKTVIFKPLNKIVIRKIVDIELVKVAKRLAEQMIKVKFTKTAKDWIGEKGFMPEFGARPMRRVISENIEDQLSEAILTEAIKPGDTVEIGPKDKKIVYKVI